MNPSLRQATLAEAGELALFAETCFREAFGQDFTPKTLDRLCGQAFARSLIEELIGQGTWLAVGSEGWRGYIALGRIPCPLPNMIGPTMELARLYVSSRWQGHGVADALMTTFLAEVRRRGANSVWLQAYEGNPRALAFYRRWGFTDFGPFEVACDGLILPHRALGQNLP